MSTTHSHIPAGGLKGLRANWKSDLVSGFLVFLIALPLCLGISMASGFPPVAGIFTAIIGGMLVSFFKGSELTIKGPAAGLIVIALGAVEELGQGDPVKGYHLALAAIVAAGVIQIIFGLLRSGVLSDFFPSAAVHGMLAAIGIIIASKQIHTIMGVKPEGMHPIDLLAEIPESISKMNPEIAIIGAISLAILFTLPLIKNKYVKMIPAPLVVILVAVPLGHLFQLETEHKYLFLNDHEYTIGPRYLVTLPDNLASALTFPDFSALFSGTSIKFIIMFALVGSLESLLSTKAIDSLDPWRRKSNMNRDLIGVGVGNTLAGLIGGLPMISEIVRSSANINNGGRTWWSNFFHGFFLLVFVAFFPSIIHQIPLAALGAMLIYTGYRLASPREFYKTYKIGKEQLIIFLSTVVITLATDLLIGIAAGISIKLIMHLINGLPPRYMFKPLFSVNENPDNNMYVVDVKHSAVFSNFILLKKSLDRLPRKSHVIVDFSEAQLVDHTVMENLHRYMEDFNHEGGVFEITGFEHHRKFSNHELSARKKRNGNGQVSKALMLAVLITMTVLSARAQSVRQTSEQTHFWGVYTGTHRLSSHFSVYTEYQWRRDNWGTKWQQSLLRVGIDYQVKPDLAVAVGYGWIVTFPYGDFPIALITPEHRIWEQLVTTQKFGRVHLQHRYRLEQRFVGSTVFDENGTARIDGSTYSNRARYRLMMTIPVNSREMGEKTWFVSAADEPFISFGNHVAKNILDQNRLYGGIGFQIKPGRNIQIGYLQQLVLKPDGIRMEYSHTLQASVNWNLDLRNESANPHS